MTTVTVRPPAAAGPPRTAWAVLAYAVLALVCFGVPVLPLVGHPSQTLIARDQFDSSLFVWFFAWWPHALGHGLDPLVTHAMFAPDGFNLQWTTSMPLPGVLLAPLTVLAGPEVSYNVCQLLSPILSAATAFILCRHVCRRGWPAFVGGLCFGFSPYTLAHLTGSPFLGLAFLMPVFVLLVLRALEGSLTPRRFTVLIALALAAQFLISTEVLATALLFGLIALVGAAVLWPEHRRALRAVGVRILLAGAGAAVLVSPFLLVFFFGQHHPPAGTRFSADLLSFVRPPDFMAVLGRPASFVFGSGEAFVGFPLIVLLLAFGWTRRAQRSTWLILGAVVIALVLALGPRLHVNGQASITLPWRLLAALPVLRYAIPIRLALYAVLPAAIAVSLWLSETRSWWRPALVALIAVSFAPAIGSPAWQTRLTSPAFFASGAYRHELRSGERVLTEPTLGENERWQADSGFRFALAAGYAGAYPASYTRFPAWNMLLTGRLTAGYAAALRHFVTAKGVTAIVVDRAHPGPWRQLFGTLGVRPQETGGVLLYRLPGAVPPA